MDRAGIVARADAAGICLCELRHALQEAALAGVVVTDEAQAIERMGLRPTLVQGSPFNIKVTRAARLGHRRENIEDDGGEADASRTGFRRACLRRGGPCHVWAACALRTQRGVVAHSDGDVVIHALCDAMLGALGDGDIGQHFPDSDPRYRGADSRVFLRVVAHACRRPD